jgi:hypothetical protein
MATIERPVRRPGMPVARPRALPKKYSSTIAVGGEYEEGSEVVAALEGRMTRRWREPGDPDSQALQLLSTQHLGDGARQRILQGLQRIVPARSSSFHQFFERTPASPS